MSKNKNNIPTELRDTFLNDSASFILDEYIKVVKGEADFSSRNPEARKELWELAKHFIMINSDIVNNIESLSSGTISERVDSIMEQVAKGDLTIQQGKRLIEMLQAGFEITELPKLLDKLAEIER